MALTTQQKQKLGLGLLCFGAAAFALGFMIATTLDAFNIILSLFQ